MLGNGSNTTGDYVSDGALSVVQVDSVNITVNLNEAQRVRAIQPRQPRWRQYLWYSMLTVMLSLILQTTRIYWHTTLLLWNRKMRFPTITSVNINYSTGVMVITASETIDALSSALVNLSRIALGNVSSAEKFRYLAILGQFTLESAPLLKY